MKKITLSILMFCVSMIGFSQVINENFDAPGFPPAGWDMYDNGVGTGAPWVITNNLGLTNQLSSGAARAQRQTTAVGGTRETWLVSPQVLVPTNGQLVFFTRTELLGNQGTNFSVRISTNPDKSILSAYVPLQTWTEATLNALYNEYEEKTLSLQANVGQNIWIAFVRTNTQLIAGLNGNGDNWLVDNVSVVEQCADPINLSVTNIGLTSAVLNWQYPGAGTNNFFVQTVLQGQPQSGAGTAVTGLSYLQEDLLAGTAYDFYVRAACANSNSAWVGPFTFTTANLGETCEAPIQTGTLPYLTSGNTSTYLNDYSGSPGATGCGTNSPYLNGNDVFYSFSTATDSNVTITMTPQSGWSGLFVYNSCANVGVSCIAGVANSNTGVRTITIPTVAGQTYYVAISTWGTTTVSTQSVSYNLSIIENSCINLASTFSVVSDCANGNQFFVRGTVTNMGSATSIVASSNIDGNTASISALGTVDLGPFPNGTQVVMTLTNGADDNCFRTSNVLTQQFCPATNDLCANAIMLQCGDSASQTTVGSTTTGAPPTCNGVASSAAGLWYTWMGNGNVVNMSLCGSPVGLNSRLQVYKGSCGLFECVTANNNAPGCGNLSEVLFISEPGVLYYIYVNGSNTGVFNLEITCTPAPPIPGNDLCANATSVPVNTNGTCDLTTSGTILGATQSPQPNNCPGTPNDDVWYSFVATQAIHTIFLDNVQGSTSNLNMALYNAGVSGNCTTLTNVSCHLPGYTYLQNLIPGNTYYLRIYTTANIILQTTTFDLCISVPPPPPANDECLTSIEATVNNTAACNLVNPVTLTSATQSQGITSTCLGVPNDDVWLHFTATSATHTFSFNNVLGTAAGNIRFTIFSGACGALTQFHCSNVDNPNIVNNFILGQEYKIRIYTNSNTPGLNVNLDFCIGTLAPPISVSVTQYTKQQLIEDIFLNTTCANVTNIQWFTGANNSLGTTPPTPGADGEGIGYFNQNGSGFPFSDGIILKTGNVLNSPGPASSNPNSSGGFGWGGDATLNTINTPGGSLNNASFLQFDFIPLADQISFDFIFASQEYGTFQCSFSDVFGFFLSQLNPTTGAVISTTNIATVPGTTPPAPISVTTIRNNLYNGGCPSVNPTFFGDFYGAPNGLANIVSPHNFRGNTIPMTASATVIPGQTYRIKLAIADYQDTAFDSAIFLKGGSFNFGDIDLGDDLLVENGNAVCPGTEYFIDSGLSPEEYLFSWFIVENDGTLTPIPGANNFFYSALVPGQYQVVAQFINATDCEGSDTITIEFYPEFFPGEPINLTVCDSSETAVFNLTENLDLITEPLSEDENFNITYHESLDDAQDGAIVILNPDAYTNISNPQTIYVRIETDGTGCFEIISFDLLIEDLTPIFDLPEDFTVCSGQEATITVVPVSYTAADPVTYTWTLNGNLLDFTSASIVVTLPGVYEVTANFNGCTFVNSVEVTIIDSITLPSISDVSVCDSYSLPVLVLGNYYSASGGLPSNLIASGTVLTSSQTVYVYATDPSGSCFGEISFDVVISSIAAVELLDVSVCDSYILPVLPAHHGYFTAPNGGGTSLIAGDLITSTQTIYVYAVSPDNSDCTDETSFEVVVGELTLAPISNIFECSPYVLPSLTQGNYYSAPGGLPGNILPVGTLISTTQTIYVYASVGVCTDEISFVVNINGVTASVLESLTSCDVYVLPVLPANNSYYTESGGNGTQLTSGSSITSTQTIYIYAVSPLDANCTDETSFVVTINQTPVLSSVSNILECDDFYTLPSLSVGGYFTAPNGGGSSLAVGSQISTTQTIYVYASNGSCSSEVSFTVTVPGLSVDGFDDVVICTSYILPSLSNGEFYTASGGSGLNLTPGSVLTSSQTVYVYESFDTCFAESSFEVTILACEIPRGISPNGDQFNQSLDLTNFDVAKLSIFNRYGKEVYSKINYVDEWEGQTSGGSELPDGTYFYVVERRNGDKLTGWIYVNRER